MPKEILFGSMLVTIASFAAFILALLLAHGTIKVNPNFWL